MNSKLSDTLSRIRWKDIVLGRNPRRTLCRILLVVSCSLFLFRGPLLPIQVTGCSMFPTCFDGSINFINRFAFTLHAPRRGDVVAINNSAAHEVLLKRIIGLPGETVEIYRGQVLINGQALRECYVKQRNAWFEEARVLGPKEYFVIGDNRSMPQSMHKHGTFDRSAILGKLVLREGLNSAWLSVADPIGHWEHTETASND